MTQPIGRALMVAALQVAIVGSLGAKLMIDRATRPRVWARAAPIDPSLPIRGRYVSLRIEAAPRRDLGASAPAAGSSGSPPVRVALLAEDGQLVAVPAAGPNSQPAQISQRTGERVVTLNQPLAYFIPEHVADPSRRRAGEELWVEVTLPRRGAPRPIRLGVKKDGVLSPLDVN